jgi:hypothetical protein
MVQAVVNLSEFADRVLTIIKGKYGLKNKSEAVNFVVEAYEQELLEPELKPAFVKKMRRIEKEFAKGAYKRYKTIDDLRREIEHA